MQGMTFFSQNNLCLTNLGIHLLYHKIRYVVLNMKHLQIHRTSS